MNTKEFRMALAIAALVWNFIRTATTEDILHAVVVTIVFLIVMFVIFWFNNSFSDKAKFGDYAKETFKTAMDEYDLTKVDQIMNILGGDENDNKRN